MPTDATITAPWRVAQRIASWKEVASPSPPAEMFTTFAPLRTAWRMPRIMVRSLLSPKRFAIWTGMICAVGPTAGATPTIPTPLAGAAAMPATWVPWPESPPSEESLSPRSVLRPATRGLVGPAHSSWVGSTPLSRIAMRGRAAGVVRSVPQTGRPARSDHCESGVNNGSV